MWVIHIVLCLSCISRIIIKKSIKFKRLVTNLLLFESSVLALYIWKGCLCRSQFQTFSSHYSLYFQGLSSLKLGQGTGRDVISVRRNTNDLAVLDLAVLDLALSFPFTESLCFRL